MITLFSVCNITIIIAIAQVVSSKSNNIDTVDPFSFEVYLFVHYSIVRSLRVLVHLPCLPVTPSLMTSQRTLDSYTFSLAPMQHSMELDSMQNIPLVNMPFLSLFKNIFTNTKVNKTIYVNITQRSWTLTKSKILIGREQVGNHIFKLKLTEDCFDNEVIQSC